MKASCIIWDTDGNRRLREQLPAEIKLPDEIVMDEDGEIDYQAIDDYLSDQTGFFHEGYTLEQTFDFREKKVSCAWNWLDDDTFVFQFGDGEFHDEDGDYFIHFEYHVKDNEWIVEVFWDGDAAVIGDINNADDYITAEEMENVINFAEQFMKSKQHACLLTNT